jgi:hypothetical protein
LASSSAPSVLIKILPLLNSLVSDRVDTIADLRSWRRKPFIITLLASECFERIALTSPLGRATYPSDFAREKLISGRDTSHSHVGIRRTAPTTYAQRAACSIQSSSLRHHLSGDLCGWLSSTRFGESRHNWVQLLTSDKRSIALAVGEYT